MAKQVGGLEQLLIDQLQDLFDAEKQLVRALPRMAKNATDEELETALRQHLEVTRGQVQRLEQVFATMDTRARSRPCKGMKGIVEEGQEVMEEKRVEILLDSAITGAARKVEHYEIAGYESARSLARQLGLREATQLLEQTLREEMDTDKQLAQISKRLLKESGSRTVQEPTQTSRGGRGGQERGGARPSTPGRTTARKPRGSQGNAGGSARPLTDHDQIRRWAEERRAHPARVIGTGGSGDIGIIRLDFPGYTGEETLLPTSWDDWFRKFDESNLALMVQHTTGRGEKSNFNKLVKRETVEEHPRARTAR